MDDQRCSSGAGRPKSMSDDHREPERMRRLPDERHATGTIGVLAAHP